MPPFLFAHGSLQARSAHMSSNPARWENFDSMYLQRHSQGSVWPTQWTSHSSRPWVPQKSKERKKTPSQDRVERMPPVNAFFFLMCFTAPNRREAWKNTTILLTANFRCVCWRQHLCHWGGQCHDAVIFPHRCLFPAAPPRPIHSLMETYGAILDQQRSPRYREPKA